MTLPAVIGFTSQDELFEHFADHGHEFGVSDASEYLQLAISFFQTNMANNADLEECVRPDGMIIRFNKKRDHFGAMTSRGYIVTFFIPMPSWMAPSGTPVLKTHQFADNYEYFRNNCVRSK